jgi:hypothetical protein
MYIPFVILPSAFIILHFLGTTPMTEIDTTDPFLHLLTDALRAGPGSAQWGEAVARLREGGVEGADEYRLILRAREDIESGRDYRAVRPGPGFTRKVLEGVEREGGRRPGVSMATVIAVASAGVILAVVIAVIVTMSGGNDEDPQRAAVTRLEGTSFPAAEASADFGTGLATLPPPRWRTIGGLPLEITPNGLAAPPAAAGATTGPSTQAAFAGGGIVTAGALAADRAGSIEAEVVLPAGVAGTGSAQVFVSDSSEFSPDRATSPREVVWIYRDGRVTVDANGRSQGDAVNVGGGGSGGGGNGGGATGPASVTVRVAFDRDVAIVEFGGRRLYAGPHGLAPDAPRYVGVRFIRAAGEAGASAAIRTVNVSQSAPAPAGAGGR